MSDLLPESNVTDPEWTTLFGPLGIKGLSDAFCGGEPLVAHGSRDRFPTWMSAPVLSTAATLIESYRGRTLFSRLTAGPQAGLSSDARAADLFRVGCALYLPDIAAYLPNVAPWLATLELALNIPSGSARITAWVAPPGEGTSLHLDAEDVISIQLSGTKIFEIAEPAALPFPAGYQYCPDAPAVADLYPQVPEGFPDAKTAVFQSIDMQPGSILVLPRGHWHRTRCTEASLALSVILSPPTRMDWALNVLRQRLLSFPAWRQPIYNSSTERRAALSLTETLPTLVANTPFATAWDMGTHVDTMSPDTTLQRVPHVLIELIDKSCRITDRTTGHSTTVESPIEMTIVWILHQTGAFTLADCQAASPHLPAHKIHEQISMLIKMGALYRLPLPRAKPTKLS